MLETNNMNIDLAHDSIVNAALASFNLLNKMPAADALAQIGRELSQAASALDADDPRQAEALKSLFKAHDSVRAVERASVQVQNHLADAWLALRISPKFNTPGHPRHD